MDGATIFLLILTICITTHHIIKRICWAYTWKKYYEKVDINNISTPKELD